MNAAQKIAAFVVGLVVVFVVAVWVGKVVGPESGAAVRQAPAHDDTHAAHDSSASEPLGGLAYVEDGYMLDLAEDRARAAKDVPLRFRILDAIGSPVTQYVENHEKMLPLIVVRSDLVGFQHVHPVLDSDGTWCIPVDLSRADDYRVFAAGRGDVGGRRVHGGAERNTEADEPSMLTLTVSYNGKPVTDLQSYLGAYGHLVALRGADPGYLHVHPMGEPGDGVTPAGADIGFHATFPSAGDYRLFLDFQHAGVVRTAEFAMSVGDGEAP
jgi:hypothetical protein